MHSIIGRATGQLVANKVKHEWDIMHMQCAIPNSPHYNHDAPLRSTLIVVTGVYVDAFAADCDQSTRVKK